MDYVLVYLLLTFSFIIAGVYGLVELDIDSRDSFPYTANESFSIIIVSKNRGSSVSDSFMDTMALVIRDKDNSNNQLAIAIFDYGFKDSIDQPYKSEYMEIPIWYKSKEGDTLNISIFFFRKANNKIFEMYQLPARNALERRKMLQNYEGALQLIKEEIKLFVPPQIELSIVSLDGRKNELMLHENSTATCRAFDGVPLKEPMFLGLDDLKVNYISFNANRNERMIGFFVSLSDHGKILECTAGSSKLTGYIYVMHHPTQVNLYPEPGPILENGTSVMCLKGDGYPAPNVRWTFISGPPNASLFFDISDKEANFTLKKDAPFKSQWILNCSAYNTIPGSTAYYHRTVIFTVGRVPDGLFGTLTPMKQLMLGSVIVIAIFLFIITICIVWKYCASQSASGASRKNGVSNKAASKEKGLEAEQVILLPPGSPPNYVDLSNSGAGLPPPPPEYELMIPDETKRPMTTEKRQEENVVIMRYDEVTYAELNTSNLPMKNNPLQQTSSCNDDQVIYSQIVGTVSNAYGTQRSYTESNNV